MLRLTSSRRPGAALRRAGVLIAPLLMAVPWCLSVGGCSKPLPVPPPPVIPPSPSLATPDPLPPPPVPSATPAPTPTPSPEETPNPTVVPTPAPTVPVTVHELAPTGIYYVTRDGSVRIPGGLIGVSVGDEVSLVSEHGNKLLVSNGRDEFELDKSQVTNDPKISAALAEKGREALAAQEQFAAQQAVIRRRQEEENLEYLQTHPLATPRVTPAP